MWPFSILLCALAYLVCILATTVPLFRTGERIPGATGISQVLVTLGNYLPLPTDLHIIQSSQLSLQATDLVEFLLLLLCLFTIYYLCARCIQSQNTYIFRRTKYIIFLTISITTVIAAYIYVFTPATLSGDIFLYADYGRILTVHHANPYFIPPSGFPQDPLLQFVYWKNVVAIYGPIWMLVCGGISSFIGTNAMDIFLAFRIFACSIYILNMLLVAAILRARRCSTRTILLGMQLYAWNPLVLFESSVGGHNDALMIMFMLLGILCAIRVKKSGITPYIGTLIALTLAVLVKFTIAPILLLFIGMLFFKTYFSSSASAPVQRWCAALLSAILASALCLAIAFLFYGPFWLGHTREDIFFIFSSQPPAVYAFTSQLSALQILNVLHPLPPALAPLVELHTWNILIYGSMALVLLLGGVRLYYAPTVQTALSMTLAVLAVFLLTTNWFLPWYITWIVGLAVVCLPATERFSRHRLERGLFALALTFSFSAFLTYYYNFIGTYYGRTIPSHSMDLGWILLAYFATFTLPVLAFLIFFTLKPHQSSSERSLPTRQPE